MADAYDLVPYTEHAYAESHPDNLMVVARLAGFPVNAGPAPRVLELGCGRGGNLLPMAGAWPEATFVGVDRSAAQIRDATRIAEACQLSNVALVCGDFTSDSLPSGRFDFVLCHGVYSWIPAASRALLLAQVGRCLAPSGVAYVSFNVLPGWYRRMAARDWMRFAARRSFAGGPREALSWLAGVAVASRDLSAVHDRLVSTDDAYVTHEYLAEEHHPLHVATFLEEATAAGLSYLGDALPAETALDLLPDAARDRARSLDLAGALTVADFVLDTPFRRALLVRSDARFETPRSLDPGAIAGLRVATRLRPTADSQGSDLESFEGPAARVQLSGAARRAIHVLAAKAPRSMPCEDLASACAAEPLALARDLFELWLATPGVDFSLREPSFVTTVSGAPRASAVARWHALEGGPVTNVLHQEVSLPEPIVRFVLGRLDGRTTNEALVKAVREEAPGLSADEARAVVTASLALLARSALLVA